MPGPGFAYDFPKFYDSDTLPPPEADAWHALRELGWRIKEITDPPARGFLHATPPPRWTRAITSSGVWGVSRVNLIDPNGNVRFYYDYSRNENNEIVAKTVVLHCIVHGNGGDYPGGPPTENGFYIFDRAQGEYVLSGANQATYMEMLNTQYPDCGNVYAYWPAIPAFGWWQWLTDKYPKLQRFRGLFGK